MAVDYLAPTSHNHNGHTFPISRKAFHRGLPRRVGAIEDAIEHLDQRFDAVICRLTALESQPAATEPDPALTIRLDNLVDLVCRLTAQLQRIDRRSGRSRRRLAVIADQVAAQLE